MKPQFFATQSALRKWFEKNYKKETELVVGFYKTSSGKNSITWPQSVDEALCFGWIDGVRTSIDNERYQIRFTQRKPGSIWSAINIKKIAVLQKQGLMQTAGLAIFEKRKEERSGVYSHENKAGKLTPDFIKQFKANKKAWDYFQMLAPSYKKVSIHWVINAKQEATKIKRLQQLISESEKGTNQWKDNKYKKR